MHAQLDLSLHTATRRRRNDAVDFKSLARPPLGSTALGQSLSAVLRSEQAPPVPPLHSTSHAIPLAGRRAHVHTICCIQPSPQIPWSSPCFVRCCQNNTPAQSPRGLHQTSVSRPAALRTVPSLFRSRISTLLPVGVGRTPTRIASGSPKLVPWVQLAFLFQRHPYWTTTIWNCCDKCASSSSGACLNLL